MTAESPTGGLLYNSSGQPGPCGTSAPPGGVARGTVSTARRPGCEKESVSFHHEYVCCSGGLGLLFETFRGFVCFVFKYIRIAFREGGRERNIHDERREPWMGCLLRAPHWGSSPPPPAGALTKSHRDCRKFSFLRAPVGPAVGGAVAEAVGFSPFSRQPLLFVLRGARPA
uniref:Uncharacterized protein n=1 Tax=Myotis myotis TaxID=51298 RepID=A0A7J7QVB8_MYOMY|nr:hypothetical protein mMyoMyo1_011544 [Myotis myotis]